MQPGPSPEDLHAILSRFQNWAEKNPGGGNGKAHANGVAPPEEIREIPYEEAIRRHRSRQAARAPQRPSQPRPAQPRQAQSRPAPPRPKTAAAAAPSPKPIPPVPAIPVPAIPVPAIPEELPAWIASLPVISDTEPVLRLKAAEPADARPEPPPAPPAASPWARSAKAAPPPENSAPPSPRRRPRSAATPEPAEAQPALAAASLDWPALPELPARAFVDLPPAPLATRHRPARRVPPPAPPAKALAAAAEAPAPAHAPARTLPVGAAPPSPPRPAPPPPAAAKPAPPPPTAARRTPPRAACAKPAGSLPATVRNSAASVRRQARPARPATKSTLIRPSLGTAPRLGAPTAPPRRSAPSASPVRRKARSPKRPHFSQILATTVQQPRAALAPKKKPAPDRTRRITTRFSPTEERRIEKCAAELGITVSAYLRQCALAAVHGPQQAPPAPSPAPAPNRKASRQPAPPLTTYAAPAPSLFGGWLALLRNRFLGPPIRFSEEA